MRYVRFAGVMKLSLVLIAVIIPCLSLGNVPRGDTNFNPRNIQNTLSVAKHEEIPVRGYSISNKLGKADINLKKILTTPTPTKNEENYRVIVLFKEGTSDKQMQRNIVSSSEIIYSYSVIPGLACSLSRDQLALVLNLDIVERVYLSQPKVVLQNNRDFLAQDTSIPSTWWRSLISDDQTNLTGNGVNIAILDTGLGYNDSGQIKFHQDFEGRVLVSKNFVSVNGSRELGAYHDDHGHGTHVAGIAAGSGAASGGYYQGIAPRARIFNLKVGGATGSIEPIDVIAAIEFAITQSADVICMSFGDLFPEAHNPQTLALANATDQGITCVAAVGNSGPGYFSSGTPASGPDVISVGSVNFNGQLARSSSRGPALNLKPLPALAAPGVGIVAPESVGSLLSLEYQFYGLQIPGSNNNNYLVLSGTSMACPVVAGCAAILLEAEPNLTPETIRGILTRTATPISYSQNDIGAGIVNISAALEYLREMTNPNEIALFSPSNLPFPPYDLQKFPGDRQAFNLSVFSGLVGAFSIETSAINSIDVHLETSDLLFSTPDRTDVMAEITILHGCPTGEHNITFRLRYKATGVIFDTLTYTFTVGYPRARILFDSFHGLNDFLYGAPSIVNQELDFYQLFSLLTEMNFSCSYYMDNWTLNYNPNLNGKLLSAPLLDYYDVLVLHAPVLPYTAEELEAIKGFYEQGKGVLIFGNPVEVISARAVQEVINALGLGIAVSIETYVNNTDVPVNSAISSTLSGIEKIRWSKGLSFNASPGQSLVQSGGRDLIVQADERSSGGGRFCAIGSEALFLNDAFDNSQIGGNHTKLARNVFTFLSPFENYYFTRFIEGNPNNFTGNAHYIYTTHQNGTPVELNPSVVKITHANQTQSIPSTQVSLGVVQVNSGLDYQATFAPHLLEVQFLAAGKQYNQSMRFLKINSSFVRILEIRQDKDNLLRGTNQIVNYSVITGGDVARIDAYTGSTAMSISSDAPTQQIKNTLVFNGTSWNLTFNSNLTRAAGYYWTYFVETGPRGFSWPNNINRSYFHYQNNAPRIIPEQSFFDEVQLSEMKQGNSVRVLQQQVNSRISLRIAAEDSVTFEDDPRELSISAEFISVIFFKNSIELIQATRGILVQDLVYNPGENYFQGNFYIPSEISLSADFQVSVNQGEKYGGLILLTVTDSEGATGIDYVVFSFGDTLAIPNSTTIFIILGVLAGIGIFIYFLARKPKEKPGSEREYSPRYGTASISPTTIVDEIQRALASSRELPFTTIREITGLQGPTLRAELRAFAHNLGISVDENSVFVPTQSEDIFLSFLVDLYSEYSWKASQGNYWDDF